MQQQATQPDSVDQFDNAVVLWELKRILGSSAFHGSKRCQDFLSCVVTMALRGETSNIKERTLAVQVFGRDPGAELDHGSIVRVGAREVRKRLAQYYAAEAAGAPLRIELPTGSYAPIFHPPEPAASPEQPASTSAPAPPPLNRRASERPKWGRLALAAVGMAVVFIPLVSIWGRGSEPYDAFWQPAFRQRNPFLLVLAHPIVYRPSSRATQLNAAKNPVSGPPVQQPIHLPPDDLKGSDFVPVFDQYVGVGDTMAAQQIQAALLQRSRSSYIRLASKLGFADLSDSGAALIGAFSNRWTMEITNGFRYRFDFTDGKPGILDSASGRRWKLSAKSDDGAASDDYMIINRLVRGPTGKFLITAAGLTQHGTAEAGRILGSPDALAAILAKSPAGWRTQNLQLVLHAEIVDEAPATPELVAAYTW